MKNDITELNGYLKPIAYQVGDVEFKCFKKSAHSIHRVYTTGNFLVQTIDRLAYWTDTARMDQKANLETPYFISRDEGPPEINTYTETFGLFDMNEQMKSSFSIEKPVYAPENLKGYAFCYVGENDPYRFILGGIYIDPDYRGKHLSQLLYQARVDRCADFGLNKISSYPCEYNTASRKAAEHFGFVLQAGEEMTMKWGGFGRDIEAKALHYEYDLALHKKQKHLHQ